MTRSTSKKRVIRLAGGPYEGSYGAQMEKITSLFGMAVREHRPHAVCFSELMTTPYLGVKYDRRLFSLAETRGGRTKAHFKRQAKEHKTAVIGTFFEKAGNKYYNSAFVINSRGEHAGIYRKTHIPVVEAPDLKTNEKKSFPPAADFPFWTSVLPKWGFLSATTGFFPKARGS